jgi:hypothetical protein
VIACERLLANSVGYALASYPPNNPRTNYHLLLIKR